MITTRKGDTCELLLLLQLLSFNIKNTARSWKKEHCYGKSRRNVKKHDYENELAKTEFYASNRKQNLAVENSSHDTGSN